MNRRTAHVAVRAGMAGDAAARNGGLSPVILPIQASPILDGVFFAALLSVFFLASCGGTKSDSPVAAAATPTVALTAAASSIASETATTIDWSAEGSTVCILPDGSSTTAQHGVYNTPPLYTSAALTFVCVGPGGSTTQTVMVYVNSGCMSTGSGTSGAITLAMSPSRLTGVAPLSVFFDATGTTATATTRPFHDLEYRWSFDDVPGSTVYGSTWTTGSRANVSSRNSATGPVSAHVYERPGTYYVSMTVIDGTNSVSNACTKITVLNPDDTTIGSGDGVFTGTNTICVAGWNSPSKTTLSPTPTAGAGGCPAGANTVSEPSFPAAISAYAKTGRRVLFKRGDTFTAATQAVITAAGPGTVGSYGPPTDAQPVIQMTGNTNTLGFSSVFTPAFSDWRIMDLSFDGMGGSASAGIGLGSGNGGVRQVTLLRDHFQNFWTSIGFGLEAANMGNNAGHRGNTIDQLAVIDSTTTAGSNTVYGGYNAGNRVAFMGNSFDNGSVPTASHILRFPFLNKAVLCNNDILHEGSDRLGMKIHAPSWNATKGVLDTNATYPALNSNYSFDAAGDGYSKNILISENKFVDGTKNPWSISLGAQDQWSDERVKDVIVERNFFVANVASQASMHVVAREITVRNNVHDFSNGGKYQTGISVSQEGIIQASDQVRIYNNTYYSSFVAISGSEYHWIQVGTPSATVTNITAKNNLAYTPNTGSTEPAVILNYCGTCLTESNNSTPAQMKSATSPFTTAPPVILSDYKPAAGSYAIGGGVKVPVWSDLFGVAEPATRDMGALVH